MKPLVVVIAFLWVVLLISCNVSLWISMSSGVTAVLVAAFGALTILLCILDTVAPKLKRHIDSKEASP